MSTYDSPIPDKTCTFEEGFRKIYGPDVPSPFDGSDIKSVKKIKNQGDFIFKSPYDDPNYVPFDQSKNPWCLRSFGPEDWENFRNGKYD